MKYQSRGLLTLLISLSILVACENPRNVGLDVNPGDEVLGDLIDSVTIYAVTQADYPAVTRTTSDSTDRNKPASQVTQLSFGHINDPAIGETAVEVAFILGRADGDSRIPTQANIDSAVLVINYGRNLFGDSTASHTVQLRQLEEQYNNLSNNFYFSNKAWAVKEEVIGGTSIGRFGIRDSVTVVTLSEEKTDTTVTLAPQLRVPLQIGFVKELFSGDLDSSMMNTDASFRAHQRGFYLTAEQGSAGLGSLASLMGGNDSGLEIRYTISDDEGNVVDTVLKKFPLVMSSMSMSKKSTYSAPVQEQLNNPNGNYETVYAQAMGGLRTRFSFPFLHQLKDQGMAINKAELVLYVDEERNGEAALSPASRLTLYRRDIAGRNQPVPDGDGRLQPDPRSLLLWYSHPIPFGGFYNSANKHYTFVLTSFIQDILLGRINDSDVYVAPVFETTANIPYWSDASSPARAVLGGGNSQNYKAKLNIYYSKATR